jgi:hypothetical protein
MPPVKVQLRCQPLILNSYISMVLSSCRIRLPSPIKAICLMGDAQMGDAQWVTPVTVALPDLCNGDFRVL